MKTAVRILLTLALPGLLGCAATDISVPPPAPPPAKHLGALDILRLREPGTKWDPSSLIKADLDEDGQEDYAVTGIRGDKLVVGIVNGPAGESCRHWILEFPWDGTQDALCSRKAGIKLEQIEEEGEPARPGINLHDDQCDAFHIFWDPERQAYDWWRL
ncbi:MAG TPA: hypothetical protein VN493_18010 [Thermoanaerobaculia bacterium]|nr:hypothetical protein [Thermoanaerobaculia bacterium]